MKRYFSLNKWDLRCRIAQLKPSCERRGSQKNVKSYSTEMRLVGLKSGLCDSYYPTLNMSFPAATGLESTLLYHCFQKEVLYIYGFWAITECYPYR